MSAVWSEGWYRFAHHTPSPNFEQRPPSSAVDLVVLHSISLPPGEFVGDAIAKFFTNTLDHDSHAYFDHLRGVKVSAHFLIRRGGELIQFVSCDQRAWHAGVSTHQGRNNCNDFSIGIELEGLEGDTFTPYQYESLISLLPSLFAQYPISSIAGHEHIAPARKKDPGKGFDWRYLQHGMGLKATYFPEELDLN